MEKLTKALMTDETGQAIVTKLTALSGQMHELAMATRGSAILFESESDISVLGDGGYLAVYVGSTNPLVISGWTGDNSLVTGHLYYLIKSGTAVASSDLGEYGGAVTDTTLAISGAAADAKAVGDALADKADADDVTALTTVVAGKADADDVDARFDTVEQAIEDVAFDGMDMLVTEVSSTTYGGNLMDMSNATRNASSIIRNGILFHPSSGMFYSNPWGNPDGVQMTGYPKDADGNAIGMTVNGETVTELRLYSGTGYVVTYEFADSTHFVRTVYANVSKYGAGNYSTRQEVVLDEAPAYWYCEGKGGNLEHGITAEISTTYVPYAEPVVTHSYEYADALDEHIEEIAGSSGGGGDSADNGDAFEASYNLLDNSKIIWREEGYDVLEDGYYMPITAGDKVVCNGYKTRYSFFDSSKTLISAETLVNTYEIMTAPAGAEWFRVGWVGGANTDGIPMVVYKVASTATTWDDRRPYVPAQKIKGDYVEGDIYDYAFPTNLNSDILLASQFNAVKAFNKTRNGIRVGTFNILYTGGNKHWNVIKKELKDHSIEICAFEEVVNSANRALQTFLTENTWQYAYGSNPSFSDVLIDKALVSHYEVVSSEAVYTTVGRCSASGKPCLRTVINLPMYKRNAHQFTLSVYTAHFDLTASNRHQEATEIATIASADTSDFVIICADTNGFKSEEDAQGKRPTWEAFVTQGFTPIHYGEYSTVTDLTDTNTSIDQIFMGANITCAGYDIVPSTDYPYLNGDTEQPVSDHCMVYADLIFDYDAVLSALQGV